MARDTIFKGEEATNRFFNPKNKIKVNMRVDLTKKYSKSYCLGSYTAD